MAMRKHFFGTMAIRRSMLGVTLLELMIVVLVIGVLGVIALPSYRQFVMRSQRTEAKSALLQLQANQERFYLTNRTYSGNPAVLGFPTGNTERGMYTITVAGADAVGYTATATPRAGNNPDMTADVCTSFSITAQGVRTAVPSSDICGW
jgi:type IV pilus assembly protein PilE